MSTPGKSVFKSCLYLVIILTIPLITQHWSWRGLFMVSAEEQQIADEEIPDDDNRLCNNVDIRNNLERLKHIANCTVITGFLQLVLLERTTLQEFAEYKFPKLREVTGFVLFFRVFNLVSLRDLFPNLSVIRGQELVGNFALIFYDLRDLQEIGLKNLIAIHRGFVYTQYCPLLCYTDTIDWASITHMSNKTRDQNRFEKPAAVCNKAEVCRGCPRKFCWGSQSCQRFHTGYDFRGKIQCDSQCIGGCNGTSASNCYVCRGPKDGKRCVETCPHEKVLYHETQRCISKSVCLDRGGLVFNGECVQECPAGYSATNVEMVDVDFSNHTCYPCRDRCPKICEGMQIMYLADAERLEGCTIINGTLQIRMVEDHPNLMEELRNLLGRIEEIMGYLKVYRSNTLPSLEFFESLSIIHGQEQGHGNHSLMVYENSNLQRLFNYDYKVSMSILAGSMYFVYNPLLCVSQIEILKKITTYNNTNDLINVDSNGFMQSCNVVSITVKSEVLSSRNVTIYWTRYSTAPTQTLYGYVVYFTPSEKERSPYDGRDICSEYSWQSKFIQPNETKIAKNFLSYNLTRLKPLTKYAYYIKTYVADNSHNITERRIGQSVVHYFTTKIAKPTQPLKVYTVRKTDHSITFSWKIMKAEMNLVKHFQVDIFIQPDENSFLDQRNYCLFPRQIETDFEDSEICTAEMCCSGDSATLDMPDISDPDGDILESESDVPEHRTDIRWKRSTPDSAGNNAVQKHYSDSFQEKLHIFLSASSGPELNITRHRRKRYTEVLRNLIYRYQFDAESKEYTVRNLLPYTYYTFQLFACSARKVSACSAYSIYSDRTEPSPTSGQLRLLVIKKSTTVGRMEPNTITVSIRELGLINGAIVAFNVEVKSFNTPVPISRHECITRIQHERAGYMFTFRNVTVGQYAVRAQLVSLAGPEPFSEWYFAEVEEADVPAKDHSLRNGFITFGVLLTLATAMIGSYVLYHKFKKHHDDKLLLVENDGNEDGFVDCDLR